MRKTKPGESLPHPRLFWSESELPGLRAKANHPAMAAVRADVLERCKQYLDPAHEAFIDNSLNRTDWVGAVPNCGRNWQKLPDLILAAILTDDPRWADMLAAVLRVLTPACSAMRSASHSIAGRQDNSPLKAYIFAHAPSTHHDDSLLGGSQRCLSSQCGMVPLILDLLWNRLAEDDRQAACDFLARDIVEPFLDYMLNAEKDAGFSQNLGVNIGWWEFYAWVWSLAVIYDARNERHRRGIDAIIRRIRLGLHLGADEAGIIGEGAGYAAIELHGWWTVAEILRRMGLYDFWKGDERFLQIMKSRLYYQLPGHNGILDHGDTDRLGGWFLPGLLVMLLHSRRVGDAAYQVAWARLMDGSGGPAALKPNLHTPLGVLGYWLWYDPQIKPADVRLDPREWPLAPKAGQFGLHFVRSGWREDDLYFAFFTAGRFHGSYIHQHSDAGHFALASLGELFCAGRGYGHTPARYHNVLCINGREPPNAPDFPNGESWRGGYTLAAAHGEQTNYIATDLAWQWHAVWYQRQALVVRIPGANPYVIILDHCNNDNDWNFYDWQFQVQSGCRAELDPAETRATVHGTQHRLELAWATHGAGEYAKPQELKLLLDQRRHIYSDDSNNPHHARMLYDCLIARLSGYCGVLLAALVPRRATQSPVKIQRLYAPRQIGLVVDHGDCRDTIVANPLIRRITLGGIDAEAGLVIVRRDPDERLLAASAGDCFSLNVGGRVLLSPRGRSETLFEYRNTATGSCRSVGE